MELVTIFFPLSSLSEASYWKRARGAPSAISFSAHFIQRTDNFRSCQEEKLLFEGIFLRLNQLSDCRQGSIHFQSQFYLLDFFPFEKSKVDKISMTRYKRGEL